MSRHHPRPPLALAALLTLAACTAETQPQPAAPPPALASSPALPAAPALPSIHGEAVLSPGVPARRGTLVVGWLTPAEARDRRAGRFDIGLFRRLVERFRASGEVDFSRTARVPYRAEAPAGAVPLIVLDVDHTFWGTLLGHGPGLAGAGPEGGGEVVLEASRPPPARAPEPCAGERYRLIVVEAPEVAGAVGNPTARRFCAYLPPSYLRAPERRYPIVLLLPGFTSTEMAYLRGSRSLAETADAVARETGREAVLVGVDTSTKTGSTYLGSRDEFDLHEPARRFSEALRAHGVEHVFRVTDEGHATGDRLAAALRFVIEKLEPAG